ncbi:Hypothetical predicted protein, partial [Cloeon dipterum]
TISVSELKQLTIRRARYAAAERRLRAGPAVHARCLDLNQDGRVDLNESPDEEDKYSAKTRDCTCKVCNFSPKLKRK